VTYDPVKVKVGLKWKVYGMIRQKKATASLSLVPLFLRIKIDHSVTYNLIKINTCFSMKVQCWQKSKMVTAYPEACAQWRVIYVLPLGRFIQTAVFNKLNMIIFPYEKYAT